jgi:hypothetical protein
MRTLAAVAFALIVTLILIGTPQGPLAATPIPASAWRAARAVPGPQPRAEGPVRDIGPLAHQFAARATRAAPVYVTVRPGNSLSAIARTVMHDQRAWPRLWWANRSKVKDAAVILVGQHLRVPVSHKVPAWMSRRAMASITPVPAQPNSQSAPSSTGGSTGYSPPADGGVLSFSQIEQVWVGAGGPAADEATAATIAGCESGGDPSNYYGKSAGVPYQGDSVQASGLWQILGQVVPGNIFDPHVNGLNAVAKWRSSGWSPWNASIGCWGGGAATAGAKLLSAVITPRRLRAARWALGVEGCRYFYGAEHCAPGFDCSGLVQRSWDAAGIDIPRTTYGMLGSWHLVRIPEWQARKGDLAFFGSGHVELVWYEHGGVVRWTYGARDWGTTVHAWRDRYFRPTGYYRVR